MIMCRQVAKALSEHHYWELPWYRRIPMFIHIKLCFMCGRYHRQVVEMQKGVKTYLDHEDSENVCPKLHLSQNARQQIRSALNEGK